MADRRTWFLVILAWSLVGIAFIVWGTSPSTPLTLEAAVLGGVRGAAIWLIGTLVIAAIWAAVRRRRAARRR